MAAIPNSPIAVDIWQKREGIRLYFLSHMHAGTYEIDLVLLCCADHTNGLHRCWNYGKLYCSRVTRDLLLAKFCIDEKLIVSA